MDGEGDIRKAAPGRGAKAAPSGPDAPGGARAARQLVWLVDGDVRPFVDVTPSHRPWLEESVDWASDGEPAPPPGSPDAPDKLLWL